MNRLCGRMGRAAVRLRVIMHSYKKKGGQPCRPPLFVSFAPFVIFVIFVISVIFVLVDDQCRTAIERQGRLL